MSVALFAGEQTCVRVTMRNHKYLKVQKTSGHGYQGIRVLVHVPSFGLITSDMTFGYLACSKFYRNWDIVLNGVTLTAISPVQPGDQIMGQSF